jgi:hypothetical protein
MNVELEIKKSRRLLHWIINGCGVHCIPPRQWKFITIDWVIKHYNVEMEYFTR